MGHSNNGLLVVSNSCYNTLFCEISHNSRKITKIHARWVVDSLIFAIAYIKGLFSVINLLRSPTAVERRVDGAVGANTNRLIQSNKTQKVEY